MGKKHKFWRREKVPLTPKQAAHREAGIVITVDRKESLKRLLDSAVMLWFTEVDPLAIHLVVMPVYRCLQVIGGEMGKAPILGEATKHLDLCSAYDFLRHASKDLRETLDFPQGINDLILADAVIAFERIFGFATPQMRTFFLYFSLRESPDNHQPHEIGKFIPEGLDISTLGIQGKADFFRKVFPFF